MRTLYRYFNNHRDPTFRLRFCLRGIVSALFIQKEFGLRLSLQFPPRHFTADAFIEVIISVDAHFGACVCARWKSSPHDHRSVFSDVTLFISRYVSIWAYGGTELPLCCHRGIFSRLASNTSDSWNSSFFSLSLSGRVKERALTMQISKSPK